MSTKKAAGTSKNGRDSNSKSVGMKASNLEYMTSNSHVFYSKQSKNEHLYNSNSSGSFCNIHSSGNGFLYSTISSLDKKNVYLVI